MLDRAHQARVPMRPRLRVRVVRPEFRRGRLDNRLEEPIEKRGVLRIHSSHLLSVGLRGSRCFAEQNYSTLSNLNIKRLSFVVNCFDNFHLAFYSSPDKQTNRESSIKLKNSYDRFCHPATLFWPHKNPAFAGGSFKHLTKAAVLL